MTARKPDGELRSGWTTGSCATAAAGAACQALVTGEFPNRISITLPRGETPEFAIEDAVLSPDSARCCVVKDAGDDPDVTHGARIFAEISFGQPGSGISFQAGPGVGTVTKAGLPLDVGEPAINPVPREMITKTLTELAGRYDTPVNFEVVISVPGGEELALKTWNPRLGIVGGISILGTTGIVVPFSCSAWIHSIHRGIDVARANGFTHVAGSTGNMSEKAVQSLFDLPDEALLDMGDFAGGMLKYLRRNPVKRVTISGGFAKLVKLAQGNLDLHSARSQVDFDKLAALVGKLGGDAALCEAVRGANTAAEVLDRAGHLDLVEMIGRQARETALATLGGGAGVEVLDILLVDRKGQVLGHVGAEEP